MHRLADDDGELMRGKLRAAALFHPEGRDAERGDRRLDAGDGGRGAFDADVVRAGRASANAKPSAPSSAAIISRSARDGEVEVGRIELPCRGASVGVEPAVQRIHDRRSKLDRLHHAAVEEHGCRVEQRARRGAVDGSRLLAEERREVARDRRVLRVGQTHAGERGASASDGARGGRNAREEALDEDRADVLSGDLASERRAEEARATSRDGDGHRRDARIGEEPLLGGSARVRERCHLGAIDLFARGGDLLRDDVGEGEVHVVAAEQDVFSDGHALELERAVALGGEDGRKVARAADVDDQEHVTDAEFFAPRVALHVDPRVERGLGFLEQREVREPRGRGRFDGEVARGRVEGRRHRKDDLLLRKGSFVGCSVRLA